MRDAILIGVVLSALVLFVFLRSPRITLIAMLRCPRRSRPRFCCFYVLDMSFNIMTLGGMAAAVGLIIDDAIVMIEHIMRRLREARRRPTTARWWLGGARNSPGRWPARRARR